jgi:hypothetical protein
MIYNEYIEKRWKHNIERPCHIIKIYHVKTDAILICVMMEDPHVNYTSDTQQEKNLTW